MQPRVSVSGTTLLRKLGCALVFAAVATSINAWAQGHKPVEIQVFAAGATLPPQPPWKCNPVTGSPTVCVSEEPVTLTGEPPARAVPWLIKSQGWSFVTPGGITVNNPKWTVNPGSPTNWVAKGDKDGTTFKYTIKVTNGTATLTWDPTIVNN